MSRIDRSAQKGPPLPLFVETPQASHTPAQTVDGLSLAQRFGTVASSSSASGAASATSGVSVPPAPSARELAILQAALRNAPTGDSAAAAEMIDALRLLLALAAEVESKRGGGFA